MFNVQSLKFKDGCLVLNIFIKKIAQKYTLFMIRARGCLQNIYQKPHFNDKKQKTSPFSVTKKELFAIFAPQSQKKA